jgi:hypothetical protein
MDEPTWATQARQAERSNQISYGEEQREDAERKNLIPC